jgi:hypothetical protein
MAKPCRRVQKISDFQRLLVRFLHRCNKRREDDEQFGLENDLTRNQNVKPVRCP